MLALLTVWSRRVRSRQGSDDVDLYRRIKDRSFQYPSSVPRGARALIDALLSSDPLKRPHLDRLRSGEFELFKSVNWDALASSTQDAAPVPPEIQELIRQHSAAPIAVPALEGAEPFKGDLSWCADF